MIIFIFGDSITQGLWDSKGGWADRVKAYIQAEEVKTGAKNYHYVFNLGVDGNTTKQVLARFEAEANARLWPNAECAFIFATGLNDTLHYNNQEFGSSPERYQLELEELTKLAKQHSDKILFVDLTPADESRTNPAPSSSTGKCYTNDRIEQFNKTLHDFCDSVSLACVKVSKTFAEKDFNGLLLDGLHPNDEGHEMIFSTVLPSVKDWIGK